MLGGYKTAARLVVLMPVLRKKGKHNYKTLAGRQDWPGRLQNCSEIDWSGRCRNEARKGTIFIKLQRHGQDGRLQICSKNARDGAEMKQEREA